MSAQARKAKRNVIVLDALGYTDWPCDFLYDDESSFLRRFWHEQNCFVVIDEAGDHVTLANKPMRQCLTRGRHRAHTVCIVAQRYTMLDKTARDQCRELFCFPVHRKDAQELALDWNDDFLETANDLPFFHYIRKRRGESPRLGEIVKR